jgi:hypothetical protein
MVAITLTEGNSDTVRATVDFDLELYAGALESDRRWQDGAAGTENAYPGTLTPFSATNTDTTNTAGRGMKLACARITTAPANTDTLTIGGGADTIHAFSLGGSGAGVCSAALSGGTLTFTVSGTITAPITLWVICS